MNSRFVQRIIKSVERGKPIEFGACVLQTWYVVDKRVESPETDRIFSHTVGVLREKVTDLKGPYLQRPVLVLTEHANSLSGIEFWNRYNAFSAPYVKHIALRPIDFSYKIFGDWDD